MYIIYLYCETWAFFMPPCSHRFITMPTRNKRSRLAKELQHQGHTGFAKRARVAPSPEGSVYCPSDGDTDGGVSARDTEDTSDDQEMALAAEGLQRVYVGLLPEDLQLNRVKHRKKPRRPAVYTGDSSTTAWRRKKAQEKAAKGCRTLDAFIQRKVCSSRPNEVNSLTLTIFRRDSAARHHLSQKEM